VKSMPEFYHRFSVAALSGLLAIVLSGFTPFPAPLLNISHSDVPLPLVFSVQGDADFPALTLPSEPEPANVLDRLSEKIRNGKVFHSEMEHRFVDGFTGDESVTSGRVWVGPEQYKVVTADQHISVNGTVSRVFNLRQKKVIISNYYPEEDDFAPSRFLGNYADRFKVTSSETLDSGAIRINLEAIDPFEIITSARLEIDPDNLLLLRMSAEDQTDNSFYIEFPEGELLPASENLFAIEWPEEAEVIDLRE